MPSLPQATASASGQAQATAVAEAATQTYAAAFAALQQCTQAPSPAATPAPSTANLQCIILPVNRPALGVGAEWTCAGMKRAHVWPQRAHP